MKVIRPVLIRKVEKVALETDNGAIHVERLVHKVAGPPCCAAVVKTNLPVWIPPGMTNPCSEIECTAGHRAGGTISRALPARDLVAELDADALIRVKAENPFVSRFARRKIFLAGIAVPFPNKHARTAPFLNLACSVGTAGIDDKHLVAAGQTADGFRDATLFVARDNRRGDKAGCAHRYAITETDAEPQAHPCV